MTVTKLLRVLGLTKKFDVSLITELRSVRSMGLELKISLANADFLIEINHSAFLWLLCTTIASCNIYIKSMSSVINSGIKDH